MHYPAPRQEKQWEAVRVSSRLYCTIWKVLFDPRGREEFQITESRAPQLKRSIEEKEGIRKHIKKEIREIKKQLLVLRRADDRANNRGEARESVEVMVNTLRRKGLLNTVGLLGAEA